ncbi:hypothetical protein IAD21_03702 [Abditibacteriota bacterium]|nr:hypothetical protein IAD21_03702 [Abditibacteriota bacterium]
MTWIPLGNPHPSKQPVIYKPIVWSIGKTIELPTPKNLPKQDLNEIISSRRTRRTFEPLSLQELSNMLWCSAKCQKEAESPFGFALEWRPVPSGGAIHPIHIAVLVPDESLIWLYNPRTHCLSEIQQSQEIVNGLRDHVATLLSPQMATVLLFVAEPGKTLAKYADGCSLIWRDAGVLLGHLSIVTEAMNLNYCPLGITGEPWGSQLDSNGQLVGVGVALVGAR